MSATVIDAFLMTLGLDTKGLKAGQKDAEASMKQVERQAVETAQAVKEQGSVAGEFYSGLIEKAAAFFAFIAGGMELKEFVKGTVEAEVETQHLSDLIGLSGVEIQKWRGALVLADGKAGEFDSSIKHLSGSLVDIAKSLPKSERAIKSINAALGEGYIQKGQKKDLLAVLDDLSKKAATMDIQTGTRLMERIFGERSEAMTRLLRKGPEGILEAKKKAESFGLFSEEDIKVSAELKDSWNELGLAGSGLARGTIMGLVTPALQSASVWLGRIAEWAHKNPQIIKLAFVGIAAAIGTAAVAAAGLMVTISPIAAALAAVSAAVGLLAAGAYELYTEWATWGPEVEKMFPGMTKTLETAKQGMDEYSRMWKAMLEGNEALAEQSATRVLTIMGHLVHRMSRQIAQVLVELLRTPERYIEEKWKEHKEATSTRTQDTGGLQPGTAAYRKAHHDELLSGFKRPLGVSYEEHVQPFTLGPSKDLFLGENAQGAKEINVHVAGINVIASTNEPEEFGRAAAESFELDLSKRLVAMGVQGVW